MLPKVVPSTREPGSGRDQVSAAAHQAAGSIVECATADNAALHDTSIPRNQAPHGQHDRNHHLPTRCCQPHRRTSESVGVPGDNDGPDGVTSHWTSAPTRLAQAITSCRACATSISRLLLIKLLNSSNTCYINAHIQVADILKHGTQEQAWRDVYHARRPVHVHALKSWRTLLRNWANIHMQQDACTVWESASHRFFKAGGNQELSVRLMAPSPGVTTSHKELSRWISRTMIDPSICKALSTTGAKGAPIYRHAPTCHGSCS